LPATYIHSYNNPINYTDPSGLITQDQAKRADEIIAQLASDFSISVSKDYGFLPIIMPIPYPEAMGGGFATGLCQWNDGLWDLAEMEIVLSTITHISDELGGVANFRSIMGNLLCQDG
jgi:hypothetical protein